MPKPLDTTRDFIIQRQHDLAQKIVARRMGAAPGVATTPTVNKAMPNVWKMPGII